MSDVDDDVFLSSTTPGYTPHTWEGQAAKAYNDAFKFDVAPPGTSSTSNSGNTGFIDTSTGSIGISRPENIRKPEPDSPVWQYADKVENKILRIRNTKTYRFLAVLCSLLFGLFCYFGPITHQLNLETNGALYVLTGFAALAGAYVPRTCLWVIQVIVAIAAVTVEMIITLLKIAFGLAVIGGIIWLVF